MTLFSATLVFISIMVLLTLEINSYIYVTGNNYMKDVKNKPAVKIAIGTVLCIICYIIIKMMDTYIIGNQFGLLSDGLIIALTVLSIIVVDKLNHDSIVIGIMIGLFATMIFAIM